MRNLLSLVSIYCFGFYSSLFADYNKTANAINLNIYLEDYNQLMALVGLFVGFTIMFFSIYIIILIAKK